MTSVLNVQRDGRVLYLTLNRPEKKNALNALLCEELSAAFEEANRNPGAGSILLAGAGESFCAGLDFEDEAAIQPETSAAAFHRLFRAAATLNRPLVAAVHGAVLGGGVLLAACAHVVVAAQGSSFGVTGIRAGVFPAVAFLPLARVVGERRALELCLSGRIFTTPEAQQYGLVTHTAPAFEYDDRAEAIARQLAHSSPAAVAAAFRFLRALEHAAPSEQLWELGRAEHARALATSDFAEGLRARREGRPPQWEFPQ